MADVKLYEPLEMRSPY